MAEPIDNSNSNSNSNKEINNGSTESINENNSNNDEENKKKNKKVDPEIFSCLLQPMTSDSGPHYIGIRRLLLFRKAHSGVHRRLDWRSNGKGYVTFVITFAGQEIGTVCQATKALRETVDDGFNLRVHSPICSRWTAGLPARTSFSSTASDNDSLRCRGAEPAYSFVGMHCIFDQCKAAVTVLKFGYMSSDLLAYGASDGTLTVCTVTEPPSVIKKLEGHSKDVTDFDFSSNNQYIASASMDKTVRGWELPKGICIRVIYGVSSQLCIRFLILYSISALAGLLINWCLMIRLLLWTVITLVTSFSVGMHRNVYTPQAWTHKQVRCFGLIAIEVVARANIKLQQYGTGVSLC